MWHLALSGLNRSTAYVTEKRAPWFSINPRPPPSTTHTLTQTHTQHRKWHKFIWVGSHNYLSLGESVPNLHKGTWRSGVLWNLYRQSNSSLISQICFKATQFQRAMGRNISSLEAAIIFFPCRTATKTTIPKGRDVGLSERKSVEKMKRHRTQSWSNYMCGLWYSRNNNVLNNTYHEKNKGLFLSCQTTSRIFW